MTTTPAGIDRAEAEATLYRVAICAFTYYPDKPLEEPGYDVAEDIAWCVAPVAGLPPTQLDALRDTVWVLITTPTADRQGFIRDLAAIVGDSAAGFEGV